MTKAFDLKDLGEKLKSKGLPVLETTAEQTYAALTEWLLESAAIKGGLVAGIVPVALSAIDGYAKEHINQIDGQPG